MILTGRPAGAEEALAMGLANQSWARDQAREAAEGVQGASWFAAGAGWHGSFCDS